MKRTPLKRGTKTLKRSGFNSRHRATGLKRPRQASKKKKTTPTTTQLKKKLWEQCKRLTRERHGNVCYTCYKQGLEGAGWQTGHFIASSVCSVELRYSLDNLRPQCYRCNINLSGNWLEFEKHLKQDGVDVEELKQRNERTKNLQYDSLWYQKKLDEYLNM